MKNKIIDHFMIFSNFCLVIGTVVTSILIIVRLKDIEIKSSYISNINELYLPFYVFFFIAAVFLIFHIYFKRQYLILIKMHITKKTLYSYIASFVFAIFILLFSTIWMSCAPFLSSSEQRDWYFYTLIGIIMFLTIINVCLDNYAKFGVKIDLTKKRMGEPFGSENDLIKK